MQTDTITQARPPADHPHTCFTELVGCEIPIQQAAFGTLSVELVTAVSAAGGLGMIGAPLASADALSAAFDRIRAITDAPVGVNFVAPFFDPGRDGPALEVAIERAAVVEFFYGSPDRRLVERIHSGGSLATWQVGSVSDALAAARAGCDLVILQGQEAGGHLAGTRALLPLLCEVLDVVDVPVLAAGGITTPRALAAVLAAGAAGARIGTALVASEESDFHPNTSARCSPHRARTPSTAMCSPPSGPTRRIASCARRSMPSSRSTTPSSARCRSAAIKSMCLAPPGQHRSRTRPETSRRWPCSPARA